MFEEFSKFSGHLASGGYLKLLEQVDLYANRAIATQLRSEGLAEFASRTCVGCLASVDGEAMQGIPGLVILAFTGRNQPVL